jgi:dephospho-CoA kinase
MELVGFDSVWKQLGYERRSPETLGVQAWTDAAHESMPKGSALFFKQLRTDRVLRPI